MSVVRVGLLGYGQVGQAVVRVARASAPALRHAGVSIEFVAALVRDRGRLRPGAADAGGPAVPLVLDAGAVFDAAPDVVVEVLGGAEPARTLVARALGLGLPVVTANKTVVARHGVALAETARRHTATFAYEAAVLAGVPCLGALARRPLVARARRILGIVNGTSNAVMTAMRRGATAQAALGDAQARGYAEPDATADLSGRDAAEKLAILLQITGANAVAPDELPRTSVLDVTCDDHAGAARAGGVLKPVAWADCTGRPGAWVGPAFVCDAHPLARVDGVENALSLTGHDGHTVMFTGPGAGPDVTAATVIDDVVEMARASRPAREAAVGPPCLAPSWTAPPITPWFVSITRGAVRHQDELARYLASRGIPARRLDSTPASIVGITTAASRGAVEDALAPLRRIGGRAETWPAIGVDHERG